MLIRDNILKVKHKMLTEIDMDGRIRLSFGAALVSTRGQRTAGKRNQQSHTGDQQPDSHFPTVLSNNRGRVGATSG